MDAYLVYTFTLCPMREEAAEVLAALLTEEGFEGFEFTDTGLVAYIPALLQPACLPLQAMEEMEVEVSYTVRPLPQEDWNARWETEGFRPIVIGSLCALHKPADYVGEEVAYDILIEPRQAFGSGTHATTRMLVERLLTSELTGRRCLDMGCGTGVLAICMALRGAAQVTAIDIDPDSVANARHNALLNGLEAKVDVHLGDASAIEGVYDCIVANIHRNIIVADMPVYAAHLAEGGQLLVSGFFAEDAEAVEAAAMAVGCSLRFRQADEEGWTMMVFAQKQ